MSIDELHVLVVEDEPSFAEALTVGLRREGFQVTVASDGISALGYKYDSPRSVEMPAKLAPWKLTQL